MSNKILTKSNGEWTPHSETESSSINLSTIAQLINGNSEASWKSYSNYNVASHEAMVKNVISGRCIQYISQAIGSLKWVVSKDGEPLENHPLIDLLNRPNPSEGNAKFFTMLQMYKLIAGETYIRAIRPRGTIPSELELLRPDRVLVNESNYSRLPRSYTYNHKSSSMEFLVDQLTGKSDVLQIAFPHPLEDHRGLSPTEQAARMIDLHNQYTEFNKKQLQNGASISGMIVAKDNLNPEGKKHLKDEFDKSYTGIKNAGKPLFATGDITWESMGQSNRELNYMEGLIRTAIDIATAYGVPPNLVGIQEASTFGNMAEMRLDVFEGCILPEADIIVDELNNWLVDMFEEDGLAISYNKDKISALAPRRAEKVETLLKLKDILTVNEIRLELGYPSIEEEEVEVVEPEVEVIPEEVVDEEMVEEIEEDEKSFEVIEMKSTGIEEEHSHTYNPEIKNGTSSAADDGHVHSYTIGANHTGITDGHRHELIPT